MLVRVPVRAELATALALRQACDAPAQAQLAEETGASFKLTRYPELTGAG
jgi:hypothetical protein